MKYMSNGLHFFIYRSLKSEIKCIRFISLLIPYPSVQHFIWPLHWCLLADICNHTYIPECGSENDADAYSRRIFIDECDLYEYNCDYEADYYPINYSDCFNIPATPCPPRPKCPSVPTCPDHRFHSMGQTFKKDPPRRMAPKPTTTAFSLPMYMLKGKRRYSPTGKKKRRRRTTQQMTKESTIKKTIKKTLPTTTRTKIIKKMTIRKNGKIFVKIIKAVIKKGVPMKNTQNSDFLE